MPGDVGRSPESEFQSRNRGSYRFKDALDNEGHPLVLFQSRNRGSYRFKLSRQTQQTRTISFNLVIEVLIVSREPARPNSNRALLFQSRNRGSYRFKVNACVVW